MGASYDSSVNRSDTSRAIDSTYDAQKKMGDFLNALGSQQDAIGNQNQAFAGAVDTAGTLRDQSMGGGPNPAQAQLALTTGQNIRNQAALLAGQRGVGSNPGLAARQIGQLGAGVQQEAVGQSAALRANQQIAATQQLQQQQALIAQMAAQQVAQRQGGLSGLGQFNLNQAGLFTGSADQSSKFNAENSFGNKLGNVLGGAIGAAGQVGAAAIGVNQGGKIPGVASMTGDHPKNDTVPAMLSPGEVVIPRTAVKDPKKVAAFINETLGMNLRVGSKKKS